MKNRIIIYGFCLLATAGLFSSCEKEAVAEFDSPASLFFYSGAYSLMGGAQGDSKSYSFFYTESTLTEDMLWIDVRLTGMPSDRDHVIPLVQQNVGKPGAAVAGTHYVAFDDPRMVEYLVIPEGSTGVTIPVIIKKTADMEDKEFTLEVGIGTNDYFVAGLKEKSVFTVTMTAMAVKPPGWGYYYEQVFGTWGQVKMKFIIDHVGFTDFETVLDNNYDLRRYLSMKSRELLAQYEAEHGPLYENDGITRVTFDE